MAARRRSPAAEKDSSERQHFWLKHLRAAKRKDEPLNAYAERLGLFETSLYEAKRRLRFGLVSRAVRFSSGCEASQGDSLRELIGLVS